MNLIVSGLRATAIGTSFAVASSVPCRAAPPLQSKSPEATSMVEHVQYDHRYRVMRRGHGYYMNGHRGYRDYHPGYRQHDDFWFPAGAFVAGALIGSALISRAISSPDTPSPKRYGITHDQWCYDRYRVLQGIR